MKDRAMQALILMALEAEWEAKFEPNSFGFRPGRSAIDAVQYIGRMFVPKKNKRPHPGWVLDADLSACFDNIDHSFLLRKLKGFPFQNLVRKWLKSGAITRVGFQSTDKGTPQGGIISPLLANIALDGLERQFGIYNKNGNYYQPSARRKMNKGIALYRYADDFVVLAPSKEILEDYVLPKIEKFLTPIGLSLNLAKTHIVHISDGFNFLGFNFRCFYRKNGSVNKFIYQPSRKRVDLFLINLKFWLRPRQSQSIQETIKGLNRRIRGFCNYFRWSNAHKLFAYMNHRLFRMMWSWVRHRHQKKKGARWLKYRYWRPTQGKQWIFHFEGVELLRPYELTVKWWRRPAIRIHTSPFDPSSKGYWEQRKQRSSWIAS